MSVLGKVIAGVVLAPIAILVVGIGGCEARKAYYDWQVRRMCDKDGGVHVLEVVALKRTEYESLLNQFGQLDIPSVSRPRVGAVLLHEDRYEVYRQSNPRVTRYEMNILRAADKKVVGTSVSYSRVGGDFLAFHPSTFACPNTTSDLFALVVRQSKE